MKITYLDHSGFAVEYKKYVLIFDWYKGKLPEFDSEKEIYVFSSHSHYDHFKKDIFKMREFLPDISFILSDDVEPDGVSDVILLGPNVEKNVDGCKIRTLRSTDEGVAFLVQYGEYMVYHAGDLNWWHWAGEGDSDNLAARDEYFKELERIPRVSMNIVFFPVDARQAVAREWGVKAFLEKFDVSTALVPMHAFGIRWSPSYEFRWRFPDIPLWIPKAEGDVYVGEVK